MEPATKRETNMTATDRKNFTTACTVFARFAAAADEGGTLQASDVVALDYFSDPTCHRARSLREAAGLIALAEGVDSEHVDSVVESAW
jgi:hypothetical protein